MPFVEKAEKEIGDNKHSFLCNNFTLLFFFLFGLFTDSYLFCHL